MKYNADSKWGFHDEISSIKLWEPQQSLRSAHRELDRLQLHTIEGGRDDAFLAPAKPTVTGKVQIDRLAISQDLNAANASPYLSSAI